jgi:hypothetical protein
MSTVQITSPALSTSARSLQSRMPASDRSEPAEGIRVAAAHLQGGSGRSSPLLADTLLTMAV